MAILFEVMILLEQLDLKTAAFSGKVRGSSCRIVCLVKPCAWKALFNKNLE